MEVFRHKGHNAYYINKKLVIIKNNKGNKIKFYFKGGRFKNFKFDLSAHWHIRLPFFYWHKRFKGYEIGLPNCYLWVTR